MLRELHPEATVLVTDDDIADDRGPETSRAWAERTISLCIKEFEQLRGSCSLGSYGDCMRITWGRDTFALTRSGLPIRFRDVGALGSLALQPFSRAGGASLVC